MKVAIVGSRDYADLEAVRRYVRKLPPNTTVISGDARGVDKVAEEAALLRHDLDVEIYPADWKRYGKSAGMRRNIDIVQAADQVVAFWNGKSSGTGQSIRLARQMGKALEIYYPGEY